MTSLFRQDLDLVFAGLDTVTMYPVPAASLGVYTGDGTSVEGLFDTRDVVMSEGPVNVDDVLPVFSTTLARINAVGAREDASCLVFGGTTYQIVRIIPRDPGFGDCYLREYVTA